LSATLVGVLGIALMVGLIAFGVPIAFAMGAAGGIGLFVLEGPSAALAHLALIPWDEGRNFVLVTIPLFVLMGQLVYHTGLASDLFDAVRTWIGWVPGGMAVTAVLACALFGAVTGSSLATVATMGSIVMPEMSRLSYDRKLATGALAASGTLGILIPPSIIFVFYGVMTETSIGSLFIAGVVPGILVALVFAGIILVRCVADPTLGPAGPRASWGERLRTSARILPLALLFLLVVGGLYAGIFTPTESAGAGCMGVLAMALVTGKMKSTGIRRALVDTVNVTAMIFAVIVGGYLVARFLSLTGVTEAVVDGLLAMELSRVAFLGMLMVLFVMLGMFLDVFGMLVLTIPFVMPVVAGLGIDPVWFGVFVVMMAELALVTPPIGANVFVMHRIATNVSMEEIFRGVVPFALGVLGVVVVLVFFPVLALWLPGLMD
jgi:tripartite ATP-independent transporter DctM subunit